MLPLDACPYSRPFTEDFVGCPAFEPEIFVPTNCRNAPLTPVWTCTQLTVGDDKEQRGHFYARCLIGNAAQRRRALFARLRGPRAA
jgi:hypothetical protein